MTKLQKRILVIRLLDHYTVREVAEILAMSNSTVIKYRDEFYGLKRLRTLKIEQSSKV